MIPNIVAWLSCVTGLCKESDKFYTITGYSISVYRTTLVSYLILQAYKDGGKPYAVVSSISVYHTITCLLPYLTGLCKEGGKSHAVYSISVFRATSSGTSSWTVYRRYSDFDDLHLHIKEKVTVSDLKDWNKHKIYCL